MGLFSFVAPKDLPASEMKKVIERLRTDVKGEPDGANSLFHAIARAMTECGHKCLPDSKLVEAAVREIRSYGMPKTSIGAAVVDWWGNASLAERIEALESTAKCLQ